MRCLCIYVFQNGGISGTGNVDCYFRHNPPTMKDVMDAQKEIQDKYGTGSVVIVNWLPLSEEEDTAED